MAEFKVVASALPGSAWTSSYDLEMETLRPIGAEIVVVDADSDDEYVAQARDADAIISGRKLTSDVIDGLDACRVIAVGSVGTDGVDVDAATRKGIPVTNVPDTFIEEVADHTLALILATYRRITLMDSMSRDGRWSEGRPYLYRFPRLIGQTLGLISFGHVARAVAKRAAPFGFQILAYDPYVEELVMSSYGVEPVGLTELLQRSDIVSMHAPGTPETGKMLGEEHFRLMKPHSLFINNGRGSTVDEAALIRALEEGWIDAAGLDVLEQEPPDPENPLLHMENVTITPARGVGVGQVRPSQAAAGGGGDSSRAHGPLAHGLREPDRAGKDRPAPLAALLHGAGPRQVAAAVPVPRSAGPHPLRVSGLIAAHTQNTLLRITDLVTGRYMAVRMEPEEAGLTVGEMLDRYVKRLDAEALVAQQRMTADSAEALHAIQDYVYHCSDDGRLGDMYPGLLLRQDGRQLESGAVPAGVTMTSEGRDVLLFDIEIDRESVGYDRNWRGFHRRRWERHENDYAGFVLACLEARYGPGRGRDRAAARFAAEQADAG